MMSAAPSLEKKIQDPFIFYQKLGVDNAMIDYTKMTILFSLQPQFENLFEKCKIIKAKFEEKYRDSVWKVIIYLKNSGSCAVDYKNVFISVEYDNYNFVIFNNYNY